MSARPFWKSKTLMTVVAAASVVALWSVMICRLAEVKPEAIAAFQALSLYAFSAFALIVCWGMGMKNVDRIFSLKTEVLSQASSLAQNVLEKREEKTEVHEERIVREFNEGRVKDEDYSEAPDDTQR